MKKLYWRPRAVSKTALILIAILSIGGLLLIENYQVTKNRSFYEEKVKAAELAVAGMEVIREARDALGVTIDLDKDPTASGLVGLPMSATTSISGVLEAKQTSVNPNYAGVILDMLIRAGVKEGDTVAVGVSGSFPAINLAAYCAMEVLKVKPIVIASTAASQWGANIPDLTWLDMEKRLFERGIISFRSVAASIGGYEDSGLGLTDEGRVLIDAAIERSGAEKLAPIEDFTENVQRRMDLYSKHAKSATVKCYLNVGGGTISVGRSLGKKLFEPGLNRRPPPHLSRVDGVMARYIKQGVPVIHMVQLAELAERFGMEVAPVVAPKIGESTVFKVTGYSVLLCLTVLAAILASLYGFIRSDIGFRLLHGGSGKKESGHPEPMV
jgi:poly-gamma-glutamate system protein